MAAGNAQELRTDTEGFASHPFSYQQPRKLAETNRIAYYCIPIIFFSYLFPVEAAVRLGTVWSTRRVALFLCLVPILLYTSWRIKNARYVPVLSDIAVLAFTAWVLFASFVNGGVASLGSNTGVTGIEILIPYLATRMLVNDASTARLFTQVSIILACGLFVLGLMDLASGENIIARLATDVFGSFRSVKFYGDFEISASATQYRFGLPRAKGPIEHSILFGLFFVFIIPFIIYGFSSPLQRVFAVMVCIGGTLISLSSAPILILVLVLSLIAFDHLFKNLSWRWAFLWMMALISVGALMLVVDDPVVAFIQGFTLDPNTGMTRLRIWHWIGVNLEGSPIFGIGTNDWIRPTDMLSSVDSLWLVLAMTYGYVGLGLFALAIVGVFFTVNASGHVAYDRPEMQGIRFASSMALFAVVLSSFTVHMWGAAWGFLGLLMGVRASATEAKYLPVR